MLNFNMTQFLATVESLCVALNQEHSLVTVTHWRPSAVENYIVISNFEQLPQI